MADRSTPVMDPTSDIEEEARRAARKRAIDRLAEELQHPDQLVKVEQIKFKHYNKKISLETQLKNLVSSQLKEASEGTDKLSTSIGLLKTVRENALKVQSLARDTNGLIPHYEIVQEVNTTRNNLRTTKEKLNVFIQIPIKLAKIRKLMAEEINVLKVYMAVRALERDRDDVLKQAVQFPAQQRELRDIFRSVDQISEDLDEMLWAMLDDHFNLSINKPAVLIKVMQVVFREARLKSEADKAAMRLAQLKQAQANGEDDGQLMTAIDKRKLETALSAMPKLDYLATASSRLRNSIRRRFFAYFEDCKIKEEGGGSSQSQDGIRSGFYGSSNSLIGGYEAQKCVNASRKVMIDLEKVIDDVQHCFPETFQIRELYIQSYHEFFYELLSEICKVSGRKENPVNDTLLLFKWIKIFYEPQLKRLAISPRVPLLTDALMDLVGEYKEYVFSSVDELANRLIAMDRDTAPEVMGEAFYTMAPVTLFNIIHMHLDVAINANSPMVTLATFQEVKKVLLSFQQKFRRQIEENQSRYELLYVVALINNFDQCYEYTLDMDARASKIFDPVTYAGMLMNEVMDGFQDLVKLGREVLMRHVFAVLDEDIVKLFTKAWYEEEIIEIFIATLNDYFGNELKGKLLDTYFRKFAIEAMDKCVTIYVSQLLYSKTRLPFTKRTAERLKYDAARLTSFFTAWQVRDKFVKTHLQVLFDLSDLINADYDAVPYSLDSLVKNSPDIIASVVDLVLSNRDDLDRKQVKALLAIFERSYNTFGPSIYPTSGFWVSFAKEPKPK
jgi:hypothetical protein